MRKLFVLSPLIVLFAACRPQSKYDMKPGIGMGHGGMSDRHHSQVPKVYAEMRSPDVNENMLAIGESVYETHCASCHGIEGMGDGPAGSALVPAPAPVGYTSQMLSDASCSGERTMAVWTLIQPCLPGKMYFQKMRFGLLSPTPAR